MSNVPVAQRRKVVDGQFGGAGGIDARNQFVGRVSGHVDDGQTTGQQPLGQSWFRPNAAQNAVRLPALPVGRTFGSLEVGVAKAQITQAVAAVFILKLQDSLDQPMGILPVPRDGQRDTACQIGFHGMQPWGKESDYVEPTSFQGGSSHPTRYTAPTQKVHCNGGKRVSQRGWAD